MSFDDKNLMILAITRLWRLSELVFGPKRTCPTQAKTSAFDLYRKSYHGAKAKICLGLSIVVKCLRRATCSGAVEVDSQ